MKRLPVVMLVGCAALALQACTAIGAGIGAGIPKYERVEPPYEPSLRQGTPVHVTPKPEAAGAEPIDGNYVGTDDDGKLTLEIPTGLRTIPEGDIAELKKRGSQWVTGLVIGAFVDVCVVAILAVAVVQYRNSSMGVGFGDH